ncbi:MAG: TSUP family transporter [Burkholderiaceae bacterium]
MDALSTTQLVLIGLIFVWSGIVRSGLGFGGAVLSLPFFLLVADDPLLFLPPIAIHLLVFSGWITWQGHRKNQQARREHANAQANGETSSQTTAAPPTQATSNVDWGFLKRALKIMIVPKVIGVIGLLTIEPRLMTVIIFGIVLVYAIGYVINRPVRSQHPWVERGLLMLGGYVSGTSLTGAPLIISIFARHVAKHQLRDTLFVLWFILVTIKMISFLVAGVDLQLKAQLWAFPCALVGHLIGQRLHQRLVLAETPQFFRLLGLALIVISLVGLSGTI